MQDIAVRARPGLLDPSISNIPGARIIDITSPDPARTKQPQPGTLAVPVEPLHRTPSSKRASHPRRKLYREISEASPLVSRSTGGYGGTATRGGPTQL